MTTKTNVIFAMLVFGASAWVLVAQQTASPPSPPPGAPVSNWQDGPSGRRMLPPVFRALDANHDGVIDADEIANAPAALRTLLKKGSTTLTMDDLMGRPPMFAHDPAGPNGLDDSNVPVTLKTLGVPRGPVDTTPGRPGGPNGPGGPGGPPTGDQ